MIVQYTAGVDQGRGHPEGWSRTRGASMDETGPARLPRRGLRLLLFRLRIAGRPHSKSHPAREHDQSSREEPGNVEVNACESQDGTEEKSPNPPLEAG